MGADNVPVVCRGCQRTVRMDQVKFDETRRAYVCAACYSASHSMPSINKKGKHEEEELPMAAKKDMTDKIKYNCPKCKYNFARSKDKPATTCPYCGYNKIEVASKGAQKILSESDMYDF